METVFQAEGTAWAKTGLREGCQEGLPCKPCALQEECSCTVESMGSHGGCVSRGGPRSELFVTTPMSAMGIRSYQGQEYRWHEASERL